MSSRGEQPLALTPRYALPHPRGIQHGEAPSQHLLSSIRWNFHLHSKISIVPSTLTTAYQGMEHKTLDGDKSKLQTGEGTCQRPQAKASQLPRGPTWHQPLATNLPRPVAARLSRTRSEGVAVGVMDPGKWKEGPWAT